MKGDPVNVADRDYFKLAASGKSNISDVLISKATNKPSIIVASPIIRDGTVKGALYGVVDGTELSSITNQIRIGDTGYTGELIDIIQNLSALSQENAAGTEEASASVEEQTSSMEQIAEASEELAKLAEALISCTFIISCIL